MRIGSLMAALLFAAAGWIGAGTVARAQSDDNPPEILTSELALKTVLESDRLEVNFVIVDSDTVTEVTINGEPQSITPGDTVLITRAFQFREDVTRVTVSAKDEAGHTRTVTYTVFRPGVDPTQEIAAPVDETLSYFANYDARLERDDNPTQDLSAPIKIGGVSLVGVVPDSDQPDTRTNILVTGGATKGKWTLYAGANDIAYSKDENEPLDVRALFVGGSLTFPRGQTDAWLLGYTFTDLNLGGFDYDQEHTVSPAWRRDGTTSDGGTSTTLYGLDVILKSFARSDVQDDVTVFTLKREYSSLDRAKQDGYTSVYQAGTASEGIEVTEFTYVAADWDWKFRWDSGLLWDIGTGVQYRDYANDTPLSTDTFLGKTRVDIPARFSTGVGYQFQPRLRVMGNLSYTFNLSNKSPYERMILGIGVNGAF